MNLAQRLRYLFRGRANSILDQFDNPEEQIAVVVEDLEEQVESLQRSVAGALADEKRLRAAIEEDLSKASDWEKRAVLALEDGREELARQALLKKEEHERQSLALHQRWEAQKTATNQLKASLQTAKQRVGEAKRKYTLLVAQYKSAETKKKLQESLNNTRGDSPLALMDKLSDRIHQIEAEAEASLELSQETSDQGLEDKFVEIERRQRGDQALEALKAKLAQQRSLPPPAQPALDPIAELKAKLDRVS
jgi:phage shock protein A